MRAVAACALALLASCSSSSEPPDRFVAQDEGFSLAAPRDWTSSRDKGAVIFASPENPRRTLAIRSLVAGDPTIQEQALAATQTVLEKLPEARITATRRLTGPMRGIAYELTFVPPGARRRYARTHVVLVGDQHVFHVIETVPAGDARKDGLVDAVIASFREEV
jgi:hypothetical protein